MALTEENGRTLAVMQTEIKHLREETGRLRGELVSSRVENGKRYKELYQEFKYLSAQIVQLSNDHLQRIVDLEKRDIQVDERWVAHQQTHTRQSTFMAAFSAVLAGIATILGIFFGRP